MVGNKTEQSTHYEIGNVSFVITNGFFLKTDTAVFILFMLFSFPLFLGWVYGCVHVCEIAFMCGRLPSAFHLSIFHRKYNYDLNYKLDMFVT